MMIIAVPILEISASLEPIHLLDYIGLEFKLAHPGKMKSLTSAVLPCVFSYKLFGVLCCFSIRSITFVKSKYKSLRKSHAPVIGVHSQKMLHVTVLWDQKLNIHFVGMVKNQIFVLMMTQY